MNIAYRREWDIVAIARGADGAGVFSRFVVGGGGGKGELSPES